MKNPTFFNDENISLYIMVKIMMTIMIMMIAIHQIQLEQMREHLQRLKSQTRNN